MNIKIDRDMILVELYGIRAKISEFAYENSDAKESVTKIDSLITLISNAPSAENNSNFPRPRLRKWNNQD